MKKATLTPINKIEQGNSTTTVEAKKTICLIQITRIGDVIQTFQAALALKSDHPDIRLILVARKKFAKPLQFILDQVFDKCFFLDFHELTGLPNNTSADTIIKNFETFIAEINNEDIGVSINLSFSKTSSYLSSLINATFKMGPKFDLHNNLVVDDKWSQFVYSNVMGGPLNPFSLVDIYKKMLGVTTMQNVKSTNPIKKINRILIHPFASTPKKRWDIAKWSEVIYKLLKECPELIIDIVGDSKEKNQAEEIFKNPLLKKFTTRLNNHVGQTSIKSLVELMNKVSFFIGHDSMVGHLASLYNVPSFTISLGTVRPIETTPYGAGNYVLAPRTKCFPCFANETCEFHQCHADIPYQVVCSAILEIVKNNKISEEFLIKNNSMFYLGSLDLWRTDFSSAGLLTLRPILQKELKTEDLMRLFYRVIWLYSLANEEEKNVIPSLSKNNFNELEQSKQGIQHLYELAEFGKKYSKYILQELAQKTVSLGKIRDLSYKIDEIDRLQNLTKKSYPMLAPIIDYFSLVKSTLQGKNLVELTESSFLAYNDCSVFSQTLHELTEKTLHEFRQQNNIKNIIQTPSNA